MNSVGKKHNFYIFVSNYFYKKTLNGTLKNYKICKKANYIEYIIEKKKKRVKRRVKKKKSLQTRPVKWSGEE